MPTLKEQCPVCGEPRAITTDTSAMNQVACELCGHYRISQTARACLFTPREAERRHLLSGLLRTFWETTGKEYEVKGSWDAVLKTTPVTIPADTDLPAKADAILRHIRRKSTYLGAVIDMYGAVTRSIAFCRNDEEFRFCLKYLGKRELIEFAPQHQNTVSWEYRITPAGWAYLAGAGVDVEDQGFIAMAFSAPFADDLWLTGLNVGIETAGYKSMRIDSKPHNNRIDDEIVAEIRKSRFVVADLTGKNAGAYFEAGFAMGLGKPVFWTCQQSEIDANNVHFDTRQYSIVSWTENEWPDFTKRLTQRIEATLGRGRYKPALLAAPTEV